ncbi:MAG: sigma-E factor negative regulatory protein [Noviherbaspirillum sp.]
MDTNKMMKERISALSDGELGYAEVDGALAELRSPEGRTLWQNYHEIGDMIRSEEMTIRLSPDFSARMSAMLAAEPTYVAPAIEPELRREAPAQARQPWLRRFALPGAAAAALAALGLAGAPQLMVALEGAPAPIEAPPAMAKVERPVSHGSIIAAAAPAAAGSVDAQSQPVMLRDMSLDEYLMAHQRFSPSVYSSAQFARSSTFANESGK